MIRGMKTSRQRVDRILAWAAPACLVLLFFVVWESAQTWADSPAAARIARPIPYGQTRLWPCPGFVVAAAGGLPAGTLAIDFHPSFDKPYGLRVLPDGRLQRARDSVGYRYTPLPPPPPGLDVPVRESRAYDWREAWLQQPVVEQWWMSSDLHGVPGAWRTEASIPPALVDRVSRSIARQLAWQQAPAYEGLFLLDPTTVVIRQQGACGVLLHPGDETTAAGLLLTLAELLWQDRVSRAQSQQALEVLAARLDSTLGQQPWLRMGRAAIPKAPEDTGVYGHGLPARPPYRPPTAREGSWPVQGPWQPVTRQAGVAAGL